jgi:hypothetical protein
MSEVVMRSMFARVAELADALDLGSSAARRVGSSPSSRIPLSCNDLRQRSGGAVRRVRGRLGDKLLGAELPVCSSCEAGPFRNGRGESPPRTSAAPEQVPRPGVFPHTAFLPAWKRAAGQSAVNQLGTCRHRAEYPTARAPGQS